MAEQENTETQETTEPQGDPADLGDAGKRALDAERKRAKAAERERDQLATRLKEFDDRDKTEQQKAADRADAAEKRAADLEMRLLRSEVAAAKGLTPGQARRLQGETQRELEKDADDLLEEFGAKNRGPGSADGGPRTTSKPTDMNDLLRQMAGRG
jgi:hypothetical protein